MSRVLTVEDEPGVRNLLERVLTESGHEVTTASTGIEGLTLAVAEEFDLITLDLRLPDLPGRSVLSTLLARAPEQRVMVISCVADLDSRVECLENGAVDFLTKPFSVRELRARVHSRLEGPPPSAPVHVLTCGRLRLDLLAHRLDVDDRHVQLPPREFRLLEHLMRHAGDVCTREDLLSHVWGYRYEQGSNVVDVAVARLRTRLGDLDVVETVRHVGYFIPAE